jgi:alkylation response protein AidB-like acyl-CoA dehydrogenase
VNDDVTDDQSVLLDASVRFIEKTYPLRLVRDRAFDDAGFAGEYRRRAGELGWYSLLVDEAAGGGSVSGNGAVDAALVAYERGRMLQPGSFVGTNVVAHALSVAGSDEQRAGVLPALMAGEASAAWVIAGASGRPALDGAVRATASGGGFSLDGRATFVQDADSGWLLLAAATDAGPAQFLLPADTGGLTAVPVDSLDVSRRFFEVGFDGVQLPASAVVGEAGSGAGLIARCLAVACALTAAESVGAMDRDFEMTVDYAKDRIAFGRPIGSFQGVKHQLADTSLALEMSKAITLAAARNVGTDDGYGAESASMAKAFVGDSGIDLAQTCFQVFGGIGFTAEHDQHLYLRRVTSDAAWFGDPAWHREHLCVLGGM